MCLIDNKRFRIALWPKKVYKIVSIDNKAPFQQIELHRINIGKLIFPTKTGTKVYPYEFGNGFFHAYQRYFDADYAIRKEHFRTSKSFPNLKIVEGWILPFTRYAIARNGDICGRILILNL